MKALILILLICPSLSFAGTNFQLGSGKTEFLAVGNPGFLNINGHGDAPKGSLTVSDGVLSATLTVDLKTLDTGMSLRNKHMKEKYLKVEDFPKATLILKDFKLDPSWSIESPSLEGLKIPGTLNVAGKSHPVVVTTDIDSKGKVQSTMELKISDFNIEIPSFMGVTVADKVSLNIQTQLVAEN